MTAENVFKFYSDKECVAEIWDIYIEPTPYVWLLPTHQCAFKTVNAFGMLNQDHFEAFRAHCTPL
jgi:hypothetical protein